MTVEKTVKPTRAKRVPFGAPRLKLAVEQQIEGYVLRWINDIPGRLVAAEQGGYSYVNPLEVGHSSADEKVSVLAGTTDNGAPIYAYLMKIPLEWHLEDEQSKQGALDEIDRAIRGGKIEAIDNQRYIPEGGISIKTK